MIIVSGANANTGEIPKTKHHRYASADEGARERTSYRFRILPAANTASRNSDDGFKYAATRLLADPRFMSAALLKDGANHGLKLPQPDVPIAIDRIACLRCKQPVQQR